MEIQDLYFRQLAPGMLFFVAPLFNGLNLASRSPVLYRGAAMPAAMAPGRANGLLCSSLRRWGVFLARTAAAAQPSDSASTGGYKRVGLHRKWITVGLHP